MADWAEDVAEEIVNSPRAEYPDLDSGAWAIDREWLEAAVAQALRAARAEGIEAAAKVAETTVTKTRDFGRPPYEGAPGFWGICTMTNGDQQTADKIAEAIRALLTKESDDG